MGMFMSKCYVKHCADTPLQLRARIWALEEEIRRLRQQRESREEEWRRERRRYREDAAKMKRRIEEDEERIEVLEGEVASAAGFRAETEEEWRRLGMAECGCLVEHMKEEQAAREVAVERWKQLYLTIKNELDDLILRTKQGGRFGLGVEEGLVEGLQAEVVAKEEAVAALQARVAAMEKEGVKREREIDILRQSLRILSNSTKRHGTRKRLQRSWLL